MKDYLEDAQIRIEEANYAISSWLYKYDGLNPSPNFFEETKNLLSPVPKIVEQKTKDRCFFTLTKNSYCKQVYSFSIEYNHSKEFQRRKAIIRKVPC